MLFKHRKFSQYSFLISSIALFILFDLGVLGLNIYTSTQIQKQTERIDLAARQRTLTQQLSKATLYIKSQRLRDLPYNAGLDELRDYFLIFDQTQSAFMKGGETRATDEANKVRLSLVESPKARDILNETQLLWDKFRVQLSPFFEDLLLTDEEILPASEFITANNGQLFLLMNNLTNQFKAESEKQTYLLRVAQFVGILLATINFFVILFHFIRQLRQRDEQVAKSQQEVSNIMETVDQGLFLLNEDGVIMENHSASMHTIFGGEEISGQKLDYFLQKFIGKKDLQVTASFLDLLFDPTKWGNLLDDLNPLKQIPVRITDRYLGTQDKFLSFNFKRVSMEEEWATEPGDKPESVKNVLVTVTDVTDVVLLEREIDRMKEDSGSQMQILSAVAKCPDKKGLKLFLKNTKAAFEEVNAILKSSGTGSDVHRERANGIMSLIHRIKGDSASLSLNFFSESCHDFESSIKEILANDSIRGEQFLPLTIALRELRAQRRLLEDLALGILESANVSDEQQPAVVTRAANQSQFDGLSRFVKDMAKRQEKRVEFIRSGFNEHVLDDKFSAHLKSIVVQLLRNAVAHGIESPTDRRVKGKKAVGLISANLVKHDAGQFRLIVEDDGKGFSKQEIVETALKKNLVTQQELNVMNNRQVFNLIFKPGFSSSDGVDIDKGQGMGMAVVKRAVDEVGGFLSIRASGGAGCRIIVVFPADVVQPSDGTQNAVAV
ncbi:MAG: ATP-binding protein [Arenicella sp.]